MKRVEITKLTAKQARAFFLSHEAYSTLQLPSYINFNPILEYIKSQHKDCKDKTHLQQFQNEIELTKAQHSEKVNLEVLINKDDPLSYRKISIANPFIYYFLAKTITKEENWQFIQERFELFATTSSKIHVSSIPSLRSKNDRTLASASILRWWNELEQQSIRNLMRYELYIQTDIANCYPSIYVHSISWALHTREECKKNLGRNKTENRKEKQNLGYQIEQFILKMQSGETIGIPLGSILFDLIAELVLGYIDLLLYEKIKNFSDVEILRFRDDYRIFCNSQQVAKTVLKNLNEVLQKFKLNLNPSKTKLNTNIALSSIKPDKLDRINNPFHKSTLQEQLLKILIFSERHPNSGSIARELSKILKRLERNKFKIKNEEKVKTAVAITTQIATKNTKYFNLGISIISHLLNLLPNQKDKELTYNQIKDKIRQLANIDFLEIWLQRLALGINIQDCNYENRLSALLCKRINNDKNVLWNFDWTRPNALKNLPINDIFSLKTIQKLPTCITSEEVCIFDAY